MINVLKVLTRQMDNIQYEGRGEEKCPTDMLSILKIKVIKDIQLILT
jgi:hypothetical protein